MPEISRFRGIIIQMYWEPGGQHHAPHFHVIYGDTIVPYSITSGDPLAGKLPRRQHRLVAAWIELHRDELMDNWQRANNRQPLNKIAPLR